MREGLSELSAFDTTHELDAVGQAGLGNLPGESLTQRTIPIDLEERIGAGNAPDGLSEGAHDLQGPLALNPSQGGHDRDRPVRPSFLGTGTLQVPVLDGDAIGQNGNGIVSTGAANLGGEHGGHGRQVGAAALPQAHGADGPQCSGHARPGSQDAVEGDGQREPRSSGGGDAGPGEG